MSSLPPVSVTCSSDLASAPRRSSVSVIPVSIPRTWIAKQCTFDIFVAFHYVLQFVRIPFDHQSVVLGNHQTMRVILTPDRRISTNAVPPMTHPFFTSPLSLYSNGRVLESSYLGSVSKINTIIFPFHTYFNFYVSKEIHIHIEKFLKNQFNDREPSERNFFGGKQI